jgi:MYXO-CTERM domain-containing protein
VPGETFGGSLSPTWFCSGNPVDVGPSDIVLAVFTPPARPICPELFACRSVCEYEDYEACSERCGLDTRVACEPVRQERLHNGVVRAVRLGATVALGPDTQVAPEEAVRILTHSSECQAMFPGPSTPCNDVRAVGRTGCSVGTPDASTTSHGAAIVMTVALLARRRIRRSANHTNKAPHRNASRRA